MENGPLKIIGLFVKSFRGSSWWEGGLTGSFFLTDASCPHTLGEVGRQEAKIGPALTVGIQLYVRLVLFGLHSRSWVRERFG